MIIEVFVFDEDLLKKDLEEYNRLYIPENGNKWARKIKIHPNDHSWFHYYKPIQVETSMYELNVISSGEYGTVPFVIIEIDNDILYSSDFSDKLYSYTETKKRDKFMNKSSFDSKGFGKVLERELKLKSLLKV